MGGLALSWWVFLLVGVFGWVWGGQVGLCPAPAGHTRTHKAPLCHHEMLHQSGDPRGAVAARGPSAGAAGRANAHLLLHKH